MKEIQWYPGHMTKARRMMLESLKQIDIVIELVDARVPKASRNPDFDNLFSQKKRIIILNKEDLADESMTKKWKMHFEKQNIKAIPFISTKRGQKTKALMNIERAAAPYVEKMASKGIKKTVRVMIVGIPNVGKSTFINSISDTASTITGNRPGVTRGKQWVKLSPYLELMDTPGLLWPKFEDRQAALYLAYIGAIRDGILDTEELSISLMEYLQEKWPNVLENRYKKIQKNMRGEALLEALCQSRGFLLPGGVLDYERGANTLLDEFRAGVLGRFTLDEIE